MSLELNDLTYFFARPQVTSEIVTQNQILVIGISEKVGFSDGPIFVVKELECVLI